MTKDEKIHIAYIMAYNMANIITKYDHENCYYDIEKQNENLNLEQNFKL